MIISAQVDSYEFNFMKRVFASKLLIKLAKNSQIYKIDESSFNRSLKKEYSGLPRGKFRGLLIITFFG